MILFYVNLRLTDPRGNNLAVFHLPDSNGLNLSPSKIQVDYILDSSSIPDFATTSYNFINFIDTQDPSFRLSTARYVPSLNVFTFTVRLVLFAAEK
jgi:hypothetical protein